MAIEGDDMTTIDITKDMCIAALEAYWGKRPYMPKRRQMWTDAELQGMHDAIRAALAARQKESADAQ